MFFFLQSPAKKPENGSLSRCCPRINWLVSNFIFPFRLRRYVRVDDLLLSLLPGSFQRRRGGEIRSFHTIFPTVLSEMLGYETILSSFFRSLKATGESLMPGQLLRLVKPKAFNGYKIKIGGKKNSAKTKSIFLLFLGAFVKMLSIL